MRLKLTAAVWSAGGMLLGCFMLAWGLFVLLHVQLQPHEPARPLVYLTCGLAVLGTILLVVSQRALLRAGLTEAVPRDAHASETRFQALLEHSAEIILLLSPAGKILFNAPRKGRVLGYVEEGFLGHDIFELLHPDDHALARAALAKAAHTRDPFVVEFRARHKDGSWRWLEGTLVNLLDEASVRAVVVNYRDVTKRRQTEEALRASEEEFRAIFELAAAGMAQVEPATGRFLRVNRTFCALTGYTAEELLTRAFPDITHPDERAADWAAFRRTIAGTAAAYSIEKRYLRKDHQIIWVQITATVLRDRAGQPLRTIGVIVDITDRKNTEKILRQSHDELELRVRERTAALVAANTALQAEVEEHRRTEEALRDSETLYHSLVEHVPMSVYRKDRAGRIVFANPMMCTTRGMPLAELLGKTVFEYFPVELAQKYAADDQRVLQSGQGFHDVEEHLTGSGQRLFVEVIKTAVRDHRGQIVGTQGVYWDVTERKQAEEALTRERLLLRTLIDHLPDYIYVKDGYSRFILNNAAHLALMNAVRQEEALGKTDADYFPPALARQYAEDDQEVIQTGLPLREREERTRDGQGATQWVLTTKVPLRDTVGQVTGLVGISRNITRLKDIEEELRRAQEELEQRVQARTAELAETVAELARSNGELQQFAYVASHDLQEPLRAVAGCVTLLCQRYGSQLDGRAIEYMALAVDGATRMQALISDLLAFSRVGTSGRPYEAVDCEALLNHVLADLQVTIRESAAHITHDALPRLTADRTQLAQLFQNLLTNAIKFRGARQPAVHLRACREDGFWHFTVADNGIGIEPQYGERIFRVFQRLHTRGEYPGTGIGLAICKKIVERHGGRIWVESTLGQGSTFHFTVPG